MIAGTGTMIYIYIFEDGGLKQSTKEPMEDDYTAVKAGVLTLLRVDTESNVSEFCDGEWQSLQEVEFEPEHF